MVILFGCAGPPDFNKTYTARGLLTSISEPYKDNCEQEVVLLIWGKIKGDHLNIGYSIAPISAFSDLVERTSVYPVQKIPRELIGCHVDKLVRIKYRVITPSEIPKIYLLNFEIVESTK